MSCHTCEWKSSDSKPLRTLSQHPQGSRSGGLPKLEVNSLHGAKPLRPGLVVSIAEVALFELIGIWSPLVSS